MKRILFPLIVLVALVSGVRAEDALLPSVDAAPCIACDRVAVPTVAAMLLEQREILESGTILQDVERIEDGESVAYTVRAAVLLAHPPSEVWSVLTDFESWDGFMPMVDAAKVVRSDGDQKWIEVAYTVFSLDMGHTTEYQLDRSAGELSWKLDRSYHHDIADTHGSWDFLPVEDGKKTLLRYEATMDSGRKIPNFVQNYLTKKQVRQMVVQVRNETGRRFEAERSADAKK